MAFECCEKVFGWFISTLTENLCLCLQIIFFSHLLFFSNLIYEPLSPSRVSEYFIYKKMRVLLKENKWGIRKYI
jgi:hypothetical protein